MQHGYSRVLNSKTAPTHKQMLIFFEIALMKCVNDRRIWRFVFLLEILCSA